MWHPISLQKLHRDNALAAAILAEHGVSFTTGSALPSAGARAAIERAQSGIARLIGAQSGTAYGKSDKPDSEPASRVIINIGLMRNDGKVDNGQYFTAQSIADLGGAQVKRYKVQRSATERTLVAELTKPLSDKAAFDLCAAAAQDCIAQRIGNVGRLIGPHADKWGEFSAEYFLDFEPEPVPAKPESASEPAAQAAPVAQSTAEQRKASPVDTVGHSSIQSWSAGDIFPAVISRREHYSDNGSLQYTVWELLFPGCDTLAFGSYDDAAQAARWLLAHAHEADLDPKSLPPAYAVIERKGLWFVIDLRTGAVSNGSLTQAEAGLVLWGLKLRNLMHS